MKRIILVFCILITFTQQLLAQDLDGKLEFGLGISPALSWVNSKTKMVNSGGTSINFGFGARVNYKFSEKYALAFELNLQNLGAKTQFDRINVKYNNTVKTSDDFSLNYNLKYIEVPVMMKMRTETKNKISYFGEFGTNLGWLLNQLADVDSKELSLGKVNTRNPEVGDEFVLINADNVTTEYDYSLNRLKLGMIFGGGVHLHSDINAIVEIGLRYHVGLTDIYKEDKWEGTNQAIAINLGFIF
jgi:hypothetical protein